MNQSDVELIEKEVRQLQLNPAVAYALMRIQHDLSVMMQQLNRIEDSLALPPGSWSDEDDIDPTDPPF